MLDPTGSNRDATQDKFRILIIGHPADVARLLLTSLTTAGFECHHAVDGDGGMTSFYANRPHLVLLDLSIAGLAGLDICGQIRAVNLIPVITVAEADSEAEQLEAFRLGADDYITPPINTKLLVARILAFLRRVYRYDPEMGAQQQARQEGRAAALAAERRAADFVTVPPGWALCNACNYMGPRPKFERFNPDKIMVMVCPVCHDKEDISYSIG